MLNWYEVYIEGTLPGGRVKRVVRERLSAVNRRALYTNSGEGDASCRCLDEMEARYRVDTRREARRRGRVGGTVMMRYKVERERERVTREWQITLVRVSPFGDNPDAPAQFGDYAAFLNATDELDAWTNAREFWSNTAKPHVAKPPRQSRKGEG